ncbi:uncharacterized protein LOC144246230 [Lonchura striata]
MTLQLVTISSQPSAKAEQEESRSVHFCWGGNSLAFSVCTVNSMSTYLQTADLRGVRGTFPEELQSRVYTSSEMLSEKCCKKKGWSKAGVVSMWKPSSCIPDVLSGIHLDGFLGYVPKSSARSPAASSSLMKFP